jgi:hypothetical protein
MHICKTIYLNLHVRLTPIMTKGSELASQDYSFDSVINTCNTCKKHVSPFLQATKALRKSKGILYPVFRPQH